MPSNRRFRGRQSNGEFSLTDMRDALTNSVDTLVDAIAEQNPKVDADGFETELRELVIRYGRGNSGFAPVIAAGNGDDDARPTERLRYSLTSDLLVAAHEAHQKGDFTAFFRNVRDAFRADDCEALMAAMAEMNSMTDVEDQAVMDLENPEDYGDSNDELEFVDEVDASESAPEEDFYEEVESGDLDDDPLAPDSIMASENDDNDPGDHEFRGDDDQPETAVPMSEPLTASRRRELAFLNKTTLSGESDQRKAVFNAHSRSKQRR